MGTEVAQGRGVGLDVGAHPGDALLVQVVAVGEVPEGRVAGDQLAGAALRQAGAQLGVEGVEVAHEGGGVGAVVGGVRRVAPGEVLTEGRRHVGQAGRVEPEVRVRGAAVVVVVRVLLGALAGVLTAGGQGEAGGRGDVDGGVGGLAAHGLVDGRLEAGEVDDGLRPGHRPDRLGGQLEVVGLDARLGQRGDAHVVAADPLGSELEGVERGRDRHPPVVTGVGRRAPGQEQRRGDGEEGERLHDNDSHS